MTKIKQNELIQLFLEIGQQQYCLMVTASKLAKESQGSWHIFVKNLLQEKGSPAIEKAHQDLASAVAEYNQINKTEVNYSGVQKYLAAKIIRSVVVAPSELAKNWYFVCQTTEIPKPGDFITVQIFQEPLVVVRQVDGKIRSFLNVCPHRQSPVFEGHGCIEADKSVLCPYHGWAFGVSGQCLNAPGANRGEFGDDFDLKNYSLQELEIKVDGEGVFVNLLANSTTDTKIPSVALQQQTPENVGVEIANLLQAVSPGYIEGETASLPDEIRLSLRIGYLAEEIKYLVARIAHRRKISRLEVLESSNLVSAENTGDCATPTLGERELLLESLIRELKQAILTVDRSATLKIREIFHHICHGDVADDLMIEENTDNPETDSIDRELPKEVSTNTSEEKRQALPIWIYGDAELFALEVEKLIAPTWQFVCHMNEIPQPGNFTWLDIIGERAYAIRTANGELFAGKLKDVDDRKSCPNFNLPDYGLEPIDIEIFYGFVFIRLSWSGPRLADIWYQPGLLDPYKLEEMQLIGGPGRYDINIEVDYKLLWENFLEDYHFPMMHKGLTRRFGVSSDCEGINGMIIPMRDPASPKLNPVERKYYDCAKALGRHDWEREKQLQAVAARDRSLPEPLCYSAFCSMASQEQMPMPFSLSVFPEHVQTFSLVPRGPRESCFHVRSYGHLVDPNSPNAEAIRAARLANIQLLWESLHEDIRVNYITQDSVSSRLFDKLGVFSIAELDVAKFQEAIQTKLTVTRHQKKPSQLLGYP
ncbi:Rieske 2Fe-2S domain-containing protein [Limnofasciculus baicalensis]|uniref:Rieske 2Fe-2S domain-containing protein n=1 Tax=Limnofasciculus baicalensis BBK-W-15 TaxID=2699891 RepID=A0AAE3KLC8_9CYAN|nr:Rieske 2Fe-2S domain-containing protein [Limnofasciculus baicalensis]MCP2727561.1 Rieske 2Fe-2S domain-containing protein [Limnofasciculus baicalensis BBK-W-15]